MSNTKGATRPSSNRVRRLLGALLALAGLVSSAAFAQSSSTRTVTVPFGSPGGGDGYESAAARVTYAFIACQGELHIAYSLDAGSATVGSTYLFGGKRYPVSGTPPQVDSIDFIGTVYRGPSAIGHFSDGFAGKALGMGCFSGQTQRVALLSDLLGPRPTAAQVSAYLEGLTVQVRPGEVLRSSLQESMIRSELRRAESEATAAARRAEEAQAAAQREYEQRVAAERAAQVQAYAEASGQSPSAPAAGGTGAPAIPVQAAPPLSREERIARAIASDKVLADQRAEQHRADFARQQAILATAQQQEAQAFVAALPAAMEFANVLEAWDANRKANRYNAAQARLAGQCFLANGMHAPKDGDIRLGVEMVVPMGKDDCGRNPGDRFKALKLELTEPARLQFTIRPAGLRPDGFQIDVRDLDNKRHMSLGWEDWGTWQRTNSKSVELPAGVYIVTVSNGTTDHFVGFKLRVDRVDQYGNVLAVASPSN